MCCTKTLMRVLLVSHSVLAPTTNMGKTLTSYLSEFRPEEVAQFYIHSEIPIDDSACINYFRFTDVDAIKSIFLHKREGAVFGAEQIDKSRSFSRTDSGLLKYSYSIGRKRRSWTKAARELIWSLARWKTKRLCEWIDDFKPDVVLFASGDYAFMYKIAQYISDYADVPMVTVCVDDFYLHNSYGNALLERIMQKKYMQCVRKTMKRSASIFVICEGMASAYEKLFSKPCHVLFTAAAPHKATLKQNARQISYIGNLGYGRCDMLIQLGRAVKALGMPELPDCIDVYSVNALPEYVNALNTAEGIVFHGAISAQTVAEVMSNSILTIHTESFDSKYQERVRFSISTKIAENLLYGPCLLAYGPEGIASIDYLRDNHAAFVISKPEDLQEKLRLILSDSALRTQILQNARRLAMQNHDMKTNGRKVRQWLEEAAANSI